MLIKHQEGLAIGLIAGMCSYLYKIYGGEPFGWLRLFLHVILAGFVGWIVGAFFESSAWHDPIVGIAGFTWHAIIQTMQQRIPIILKVWLDRLTDKIDKA